MSRDRGVIFFARMGEPERVWVLLGEGTEPTRLLSDNAWIGGFSPDGTRIAYLSRAEAEGRVERRWRDGWQSGRDVRYSSGGLRFQLGP